MNRAPLRNFIAFLKRGFSKEKHGISKKNYVIVHCMSVGDIPRSFGMVIA